MRKAIAAIIVICALTTLFAVSGYGAGYFIICDPSSCVCVRRSPKKGADVTGRLDCGDAIETDNRERNGYIHVLGITEYGEGWVHSGYVVHGERSRSRKGCGKEVRQRETLALAECLFGCARVCEVCRMDGHKQGLCKNNVSGVLE